MILSKNNETKTDKWKGVQIHEIFTVVKKTIIKTIVKYIKKLLLLLNIVG